MKRFKYLINSVDSLDLEDFLEKRGKEGWELVALYHSSVYIRLIFKKEIR